MYDEFAKKLSSEYTLFLFALNGRYQQMRSPGIEVTPRAVRDLKTDVYDLGKTFYEIANTEVNDYLRPLLIGAPEALAVQLAGRKKALQALIRKIVVSNIEQVIHLSRTGVGGFAALLRNAHGAVGLLVQQQSGAIEFKTTDGAGRSWTAKKLFQVAVRDFAYQAYIDSQIEALVLAGADLFETTDGRIISRLGTDGFTSLAESRSRVFHYNSTQTIAPHVST